VEFFLDGGLLGVAGIGRSLFGNAWAGGFLKRHCGLCCVVTVDRLLLRQTPLRGVGDQ